jgi:hypothetical protein
MAGGGAEYASEKPFDDEEESLPKSNVVLTRDQGG